MTLAHTLNAARERETCAKRLEDIAASTLATMGESEPVIAKAKAEALTRAAAALRAWDAARTEGALSAWQPIATAPRDGTPVWVVEPGEYAGLTQPHQTAAYWHRDWRSAERGNWGEVAHECILHPTHWMPLPDPPKEVSR